MLFLLKDVKPPASLDALQRFEADENIVLPQDYKDFLLQQNGGRVDGIVFVEYPWGGFFKSYIDEFFGLSEDQNFHDLHTVRNNLRRMSIALPDHLLCIAANETGRELIVLKVRGLSVGYVYVWHTDTDPPYKRLLCKTFTRFLEKLQVDEA